MAEMKAGFITGANAKIKAGKDILAYCTDVSYNITVQTIPIESMGKYEVHSNEPVGYAVDGSLSIIRYTKRAKTSKIDDVSDTGNKPQKIETEGSGNWNQMINPKELLLSETFDIEIFEKTNEEGGGNSVIKLEDCRLTRRGGSLNKRGVLVDQYAFVGILGGDGGDTAGTSDVAHSSMTNGVDLS
jgi:hypothetical protein